MNRTCRHPKSRRTVQRQGFTGCVVSDWNKHDEGAHGGLTLVYTCECGKRLRENHNSLFTERGNWHHPPTPK